MQGEGRITGQEGKTLMKKREHRKMKMTIEDYIQKQRDITYLKLTREAQEVY